MAFLDINPVALGHTLVVSKKHFTNLENIPEEDLCNLMVAVKKVGLGLKEGLDVEGYNLQENNDPVAGQIIPHIHFHIVPRAEGDNLHLWPQGRYEEGEAEETARRIKQAII